MTGTNSRPKSPHISATIQASIPSTWSISSGSSPVSASIVLRRSAKRLNSIEFYNFSLDNLNSSLRLQKILKNISEKSPKSSMFLRNRNSHQSSINRKCLLSTWNLLNSKLQPHQQRNRKRDPKASGKRWKSLLSNSQLAATVPKAENQEGSWIV